MRIKLKLALGLFFMFLVILALIVVSTFYTNKLSHDSDQIIKDNYASLEYCREMQKEIEKIHQYYILNILSSNIDTSQFHTLVTDHKKAASVFEKYLSAEEKNITESGEKQAVADIRDSYEDYMATFNQSLRAKSPKDYLLNMNLKYNSVRNSIVEVFNVNLNAMSMKSKKASKTGDNAVLYVSILGALAFLISFTFVINFPGAIGNPIIEITQKIKQVANRNYDERIEVRSKDELGEMASAFNVMAKRLKEYEKSSLSELMTEKSRVEAIVKNLNEGIIMLDEDYRIKIINPVAAELLGVDAKDYIEKYASDVAVHNDLFRELIKDLLNGGKGKSGSLRIAIGNEENFFAKEIFKVKRVNPEDGTKEKVGYIISLRNVTEFKKLDLAKTNFIAIISHELKTPISSINLSLKLLEDERIGDLNEEQKKLVNSVKDETSRLSNITKELLDISQVETGNIKLDIHETKPSDIIDYSIAALKVQLEDKQIRLVRDISIASPKVKADLEKTVWVMTNLLANAVRYTPEKGKIILTAVPLLKEVRFSVEDTGPGIDQKNTERIFQRFVQVDGSKKREGVGLGLAISKEFIQEQGGKIWVESELGVGSKFMFTLPVV